MLYCRIYSICRALCTIGNKLTGLGRTLDDNTKGHATMSANLPTINDRYDSLLPLNTPKIPE